MSIFFPVCPLLPRSNRADGESSPERITPMNDRPFNVLFLCTALGREALTGLAF
jgi:hypothetical protein